MPAASDAVDRGSGQRQTPATATGNRIGLPSRIRTTAPANGPGLRSRPQGENQDRRGGAEGEDGHPFGMPIKSRTSTRHAGQPPLDFIPGLRERIEIGQKLSGLSIAPARSFPQGATETDPGETGALRKRPRRPTGIR